MSPLLVSASKPTHKTGGIFLPLQSIPVSISQLPECSRGSSTATEGNGRSFLAPASILNCSSQGYLRGSSHPDSKFCIVLGVIPGGSALNLLLESFQ